MHGSWKLSSSLKVLAMGFYEIPIPREIHHSAAFSPGGENIVLASGDLVTAGEVRIWNAMTGDLLKTLRGHSGGVFSVAFSPGGDTIVSAGSDTLVRVWSAQTGQLLHTLESHSGWVDSAAFSPGGETIVTASSDRTVRVWSAKTGALL